MVVIELNASSFNGNRSTDTVWKKISMTRATYCLGTRTCCTTLALHFTKAFSECQFQDISFAEKNWNTISSIFFRSNIGKTYEHTHKDEWILHTQHTQHTMELRKYAFNSSSQYIPLEIFSRIIVPHSFWSQCSRTFSVNFSMLLGDTTFCYANSLHAAPG